MKENGKSKVILADRDGFYLQRLKRCLERKGEMLVQGMTDSGPKLLELAKDLQPDVILMDILLSERDGFWVLENLRKEGIKCICIMISAIDSDKLVRQAINLGAEYYMAKPIQGELLLERIHQLLDHETVRENHVTKEEIPMEENPFRNLEGEISVLLSLIYWVNIYIISMSYAVERYAALLMPMRYILCVIGMYLIWQG
ncbi:MAG: response regulator, partial [Anaerotignum sp.]|nr:response regulator [Anaerotignum sp.]